MRTLMLFIVSFLAYSFSDAQNQGKVISKEIKPKAGITNIYFYEPAKYLVIPDKIYASVVFQNRNQYYSKIISINKVNGKFEFHFKAPDSTQTMIVAIIDEKKKPVDDNNELGFILYLYDQKGNIDPSAYIEAAYLLSYYAQRMLKLNYQKLKEPMIKLYEEAYQLSPSLKNESSYNYYLSLLYQERKDTVKPQLLAYAKQMASVKNEEGKWMNAIKIYGLLHMDSLQQKIKQKAITAFPNGEVAKNKFLDDFYKKEGHTEKSILASMVNYINRFNDTSDQMKFTFNINIIDLLLKKKEWSRLAKYEDLIKYKITLGHIYNGFAQKLCGDQLDKAGDEMDIAKLLSKKALDYTADGLRNIENNQYAEDLQITYNTFADTYASILYKLGEYDSAFYYQNAIYEQRYEIGAGELERYIVYAEKVKGANFAYKVIVEELLNGMNSPVLLQELQLICKQLDIYDTAYILLRDKSVKLAMKKSSKEIKKRFGTSKGKDFTLKNIEGESVSLASFKNKVIVLDFWATWCAPCRASFPKMQRIVNKYKDDKEVVFLFIDTWEDNSFKKMQENAIRFIKQHNYTFQLLLDEKDKVVEEYKVERIPAKFIINKKGNIVFMGNSSNIALEIENAKKIE